MWTCPNCGLTFKSQNQQHTCTLINKEDLFAKRPPELRNLSERVLAVVKSFGPYREETVRPDVSS
jgi:hypothetical protein